MAVRRAIEYGAAAPVHEGCGRGNQSCELLGDSILHGGWSSCLPSRGCDPRKLAGCLAGDRELGFGCGLLLCASSAEGCTRSDWAGGGCGRGNACGIVDERGGATSAA